jgi:hypothetical protein
MIARWLEVDCPLQRHNTEYPSIYYCSTVLNRVFLCSKNVFKFKRNTLELGRQIALGTTLLCKLSKNMIWAILALFSIMREI